MKDLPKTLLAMFYFQRNFSGSRVSAEKDDDIWAPAVPNKGSGRQ